ncbi:MAG TPA: DoxX family protein [Gemmatimonadaceae bacterium]|nr:DoxX family protein [Gemmatimonadaceae bacterium]
MSMFEPADRFWSSRMLSVLRIVAGLLFFEHGLQKMFGFPPGSGPHPAYVLVSEMGLAGLLETFGGAALLLGLFTRPVAFLLSGEMAVAYFQVHIRRSVYPIENRGENVILFCFVFLYLVFAGAGAWSFDAMLARRKRRAIAEPAFQAAD